MMVLYSGSTDPFSQRCRFVLFEKGMDFETVTLISITSLKTSM